MKFRIQEIDLREKDKSWNSKSTPLTYRISIKLNDTEIVLAREYFYVGYNDGEDIDDFYFDNEFGNYEFGNFTRATFLTRNFDSEYLKIKENELIKKFYKRLIKNEKYLKNELISKTEAIKHDIKLYQNYQNCDLFLKLKRKEKLNSIKQHE